jgi:hypothetical protein
MHIFSLKKSIVIALVMQLLCFTLSTYASTPVEAIICTQSPQNTWLGEKKIRQLFGEEKYVRVDFKVSRGNCYEFYAISKNGSIVEAYYEPILGELMRFNRVSAQGNYAASTVNGTASYKAVEILPKKIVAKP